MHYSLKLADTIMKRYPNPDSFPYRSWSYSQGFMLWGVEALYRYTGDRKFYDYIMLYADEHVDETGDISGYTGVSVDDIMSGSILVWAYKETKNEKYKIACDKIRAGFNDYPRNSDGGFWHSRNLPYEMWVDGVFMGMMFLAHYGYYIGDSEYCFNETAKQLNVIYDRCNKNSTGLILHAFSEDRRPSWADKTTGLSPEVWSEGLGWYALILARVLEFFPKDHEKYGSLVKQYRELLHSLKECQDQQNGRWYQVVDKGDNPDNWTDTSGSAMFVYSIQKAIELGIVTGNEYDGVVKKAYEGLIEKAKMNADGLLDIYDACDGLCVQDSYEVYINYKKTVNAKECVAAFLWAAAIVEKAQRSI